MSHSRASRSSPPPRAALPARLPKRRLWFLVAASLALIAWLVFLSAMVLR